MASVSADFDVIVIAAATSDVRVCGLRLDERARRVAVKAGARRVLVADGMTADALAAWAAEQPDRDLVVIDATDHVVHVPLVQTALATELVVDPTDQTFAGAARAVSDRTALARAATSAEALGVYATSRRATGADTAPFGELSRHPARTAAEQKASVHFLFGLIRKAQDTWLVRNFNRKVSYPFTRMLLPLTWLTPNMISVIVFFIGAIGCLMITTPNYWSPLAGASLLLFAGYLDGCDGEIARIRLESSKLGAWIDTIADELTTVLSVTCFGINVYRRYQVDWLLPIVIGCAILSLLAVLAVYYYLLTSGTGSGNSQDYPTSSPILNFLRLLIRREVINLGTFFMCALGLATVLYVVLAIGAIVSAAVLFTQQAQRALAKRALATARAAQARGQAPS